MKTATVRQVRHDFGSVLQWVEEGEAVEIRKRGKLVAVLQPPPAAKPRQVGWPDFAGRLQTIYGERVLSAEEAAKLIAESRGEP